MMGVAIAALVFGAALLFYLFLILAWAVIAVLSGFDHDHGPVPIRPRSRPYDQLEGRRVHFIERR